MCSCYSDRKHEACFREYNYWSRIENGARTILTHDAIKKRMRANATLNERVIENLSSHRLIGLHDGKQHTQKQSTLYGSYTMQDIDITRVNIV